MSPYRIPVARKLRSCIAAANSSLAIITTVPPSTTLYYLRNALTPNTLKSMCRQLDSRIWSFSLQFSKPIDTLGPPRRPSRQPMKSLKPVSKTVLGIKEDVIEESKGFNRHAELGNGVEHPGAGANPPAEASRLRNQNNCLHRSPSQQLMWASNIMIDGANDFSQHSKLGWAVNDQGQWPFTKPPARRSFPATLTPLFTELHLHNCSRLQRVH